MADVTPVCENRTPTRQFPELSSINVITSYITMQSKRLPSTNSADLITELIGLEICLLADFAPPRGLQGIPRRQRPPAGA
jgi:hypothetical protein